MLEIGEPRTAFEQQDVETTGGELLRDHGSAAPRTDHDDVAHDVLPSCNRAVNLTPDRALA